MEAMQWITFRMAFSLLTLETWSNLTIRVMLISYQNNFKSIIFWDISFFNDFLNSTFLSHLSIPSVYPSVCRSAYHSARLSVCLYLSVSLLVWPSVHLIFCLSNLLPICPYVHISVCSSACMSVGWSVCVSPHLPSLHNISHSCVGTDGFFHRGR